MKAWLAIVPGLVCATIVSAAGIGLQDLQHYFLARVWLEALVLAILVGAIWRSFLPLPISTASGIRFSAHRVLEVAVALLGTQISVHTLLKTGPALLGGIVLVVALSLAGAFAVSRLLGLDWRLSALIACGNSICGNSAVAAVAPVIGAAGSDVAAAISFTALFGIITVLALPLVGAFLHMNPSRFGVLAGLTVYAVPQVLAAAAPMGPLAVQLATLVKLTRVLLLGPVCALAAFGTRQTVTTSLQTKRRLVPWFILAFLGCMVVRATGIIPPALLGWLAAAANGLTLLAMAGLGLSTDLRHVVGAGGRVLASVGLSLLWLGGISLGLVSLLHF